MNSKSAHRRLCEVEIEAILKSYMDEETDGEFLRYYRLNPIVLKPLVQEILDELEIA